MAKKKEQENAQTIDPVSMILDNITTDQELLHEQNEILEKAKNDRQEVVNRLKSYQRDLSVFVKYATAEQMEQIEALGFTETNANRLNSVAQKTLDIMAEKKALTNEELYDIYVQSMVEDELPEKYTFFNIKTRGLYNRGLLIRTKGEDENSSRLDVITLNESK